MLTQSSEKIKELPGIDPMKSEDLQRITKDLKEGTKYERLCYGIREGSLGRQDVVDLLKKKGLTPSSAQSTASHLMNLSRPENAGLLEDVCSGRETMANARRLLAKRQIYPARSETQKLFNAIKKVAKEAIQLDYGPQSFMDDCAAAYKAATQER